MSVPVGAETLASVPPVNTTLGTSTGESVPLHRPWRGGLVVVAIAAIAVIGVFAFVVTRDSSQRAALAPTSSLPPPPILIDAGVAIVSDATVDSSPKSQSTKTPPPRVAPTRPVNNRTPPDATSAAPPIGAGSGSGSGKPFDPYADR